MQWGNGVDGIYLFNIPYLAKELEKVVARGLFPEDLPRQHRAYPVSWREEAWWSGEPDLAQLPRKTDKANELTIRLGANPTGHVSVLVGVKESGRFSPEVTLNGFASTSSAPETLKFHPTGIPKNIDVEYAGSRYFFPLRPSTAVRETSSGLGRQTRPRRFCGVKSTLILLGIDKLRGNEI